MISIKGIREIHASQVHLFVFENDFIFTHSISLKYSIYRRAFLLVDDSTQLKTITTNIQTNYTKNCNHKSYISLLKNTHTEKHFHISREHYQTNTELLVSHVILLFYLFCMFKLQVLKHTWDSVCVSLNASQAGFLASLVINSFWALEKKQKVSFKKCYENQTNWMRIEIYVFHQFTVGCVLDTKIIYLLVFKEQQKISCLNVVRKKHTSLK